MFRLHLLLVILLLWLSACVPAGPAPDTKPSTVQPTTVSELPPARHYPAAEIARLRDRLRSLPGAQVLPGEPLRFRYHGPQLFAPQAALPLPGGERVLEPLAVLLGESQWSWQGVVRAATDHGEEYNRQLAAGRLEMLQRYFTQRGLVTGNVDWQTRAESGPSLELTLRMVQ